MKISIIIPVLNEGTGITRLLRYLRETAGQALHEIIVSDGGSRDRTRDLAELAGARVVVTQTPGRARQMNAGAAVATGDVLYFLHADTVPPPDVARIIISAVDTGHQAGCFRLRFDEPHRVLGFYSWFTKMDLTIFRFGDQSLFITRELFRDVGGFRSEMTLLEDQDMVRRIKRLSGFRVLEDSVTTSARKYRSNGIVRLQFIFSLILLFYYCGFSQETLVHFYREKIKG